MTRQVIDPKNPPIAWSIIEEAFDKINQNFVNLYATIEAGSGSVVDFGELSSNVSPSSSGVYDLGSITKRWRDLYLTGSSIDLGGARITSPDGSIVNLPSGSTVGGELIRNPLESSFKTIRVSGQSDVVADDFTGILNFAAAGITITNNSSTDTVTFTNAGVTALSASTGLSVSSATGNITITNTGVTEAIASTGIGLSSSTGNITITNTGVTQLTAGSGIILNSSTGSITITNGAPNVIQNVFRTISVPGQPNIDADGPLDVLTIVPGEGIIITSNTVSDSVTISVNPRIDIIGSVFATDSSMMLDSTNGVVTAPVIGDVTGSVFADDSSLLVDAVDLKIFAPNGFYGNITGNVTGNVTGNITGNVTGYHTGDVKGSVFGDDSTKIIDAVENKVFADFFGTLTGFVSGNVTGNAAGNHTGTFTGNVFTNLIDSADSSQIVFTPAVAFSSDVNVENELFVRNSKVISVTELKSVVAASSDFNDFKTRIAAL